MLRSIFDYFDRDHNGKIDQAEMTELVKVRFITSAINRPLPVAPNSHQASSDLDARRSTSSNLHAQMILGIKQTGVQPGHLSHVIDSSVYIQFTPYL